MQSRPSTFALVIALMFSALVPAFAAAPPTPDTELRALFDATWQKELEADPLTANYLGDNRYNDRWTDMSALAIEQRHRHDRATLEALRAIPRASLSPAAQLDYDLFEREYTQRLASWPFKPYLYSINHQGGIQTLHEVTELLQFRTVKDYQDWITRLERVGTLIDQHIALLEQAAREGRTQPRVIMQRIPSQLALQNVKNPEQSPFFSPFTRFPEEFDAATRTRLAAAGRSAIERVVLPAMRASPKPSTRRICRQRARR